MDERLSIHLIEALSAVWSRIRSFHPSVPGVILLAAPASRDNLRVLGHFAALRWQAKEREGYRYHEVVVVAEHLNRPAEDVAETLLHEAAHAMNFEQGLHDCSASQYHNRQFQRAAEALGLEVSQMPHYGFALTTLPEKTAALYRNEIAFLHEVLIHRRPFTASGSGPRPPRGDEDAGGDGDVQKAARNRKAVCRCPYIIRVSRKTLAETTIRCDGCGEAFQLA